MAASISVTLKMIDQMSRKMDDIANSGDRVANNIVQFGDKANIAFERVTSGSQKVSESMQSASEVAFEYVDKGGEVQQVLEEQASVADEAAQEIGEFGEKAEEAGNQSSEFGEKIKEIGESSEELGEKLKGTGESGAVLGEKFKETWEKIKGTWEKLKKTQEDTDDRTKKTQDSVIGLGEALAAAGIAAALNKIADAYNACDEAADQFETAMAKVGTIADTQAASLDTIQGDIQALSKETGVAVTDLSESVYSAISASVDTANAVDFVAQANALAVGGFTQTATSVDILTTILNAYKLEADQTQSVADKLITTQNLGKTSVNELGSSMGKVIPTAQALNVDLDELCGSYAVMTANGIATAETTTYLNSMLNELGKNGSAAADAFAAGTEHIKAGGLTMAEAMEDGWGLTDVLSILDEQAYETGTSISNMFGSAEAGKAANVLWSNAEKVDKAVAQMGDSAGAANTAFEKMTATGEYVDQKWQNSLENLKIAIGDAQPSLDGLMEKGTAIANKLSDFVSENPEIVGAIEGAALALGIFTAAVTAHTVAVKLAEAAQKALTLAMDTNPVFLAVTAVAALTAGLMAFMNTCDDAEWHEEELTASSQRLSDEIAKQEEQVKALEGRFGESNEKTLEAKARLGELKAEFEATGQTMEAFQAQVEATYDKIAEESAMHNDAVEAIEEQSSKAQVLIAELQRLESQTKLTTFQQEYMKQIVGELNETYPELGLSYDETTGKLNKSKTSLKEYCEQIRQQQKMEEDAAAYLDLMEQKEELIQEMATAQENLTAAQVDYNNALKDYEAGTGDDYSIGIAASDMYEAQKIMDQLVEKTAGVNAAMAELDGSASQAAESIEEVSESASAVISTTDSLKEAMQGVFDGVSEQAEELAEAYKEAYDAAASAVDGSFGLFEKIELETTQSAQDMVEALNSQAKYLDEYNENIEKAKGLGLDAGLVENLADGSQESAAALDTIINKIEDLGGSTDKAKEYISEMNDSFKKVEESKKTLEDTMVEMNTGLQAKMEELKDTMEEGVDGLNLSQEAAAAAEDTMEAYIAAIGSMKAGAVDAAAGVSAAVSAALSGINVAAYRSGQESGNGMISGITSKLPDIGRTYAKAADLAIGTYRKKLEINSPSKVFEEATEYTIDGIVEGVEKNQTRVAGAYEVLAGDTVGRYSEQIAETAGATEQYLGLAAEEYGKYSEKASSAMDLVSEKLSGMSEAYKENYDSAYQSISGRLGLFEDMEVGASKSIDEMIGSLKSQSDYMAEYGAYMQGAMELGVDKGILENLSDGSKESAAILKEIVTNGSNRIDELNANFARVEESKKTFSSVIAGMETCYVTGLDKMLGETEQYNTELRNSIEDGVNNLDLSDEATSAARKTLDAYVSGIESQVDAAVSAAERVASSVSAALSKTNVKSSIAGHADGTTYGENVYLAGEEGPELILGREGSEVFPASETAKILSAVMNNRESEENIPMAPPEAVTTVIHENKETSTNTQNRNLTLTIHGKGALDIGQSVSRKDLMGFMREELESAIMSIISKEMYEEGEIAYEF